MTRVSCIMPTADRPEFVPKAIECFLHQRYPERELIVLDNGVVPVNDVVRKLAHPSIHYYRTLRDRSIGWLRNLAVDLANGPYIAHWDDDDWSAPDRLGIQVELLQRTGAAVVGFDRILFVNQASHGTPVWRYVSGIENYAVGTSFLYTKDLWRRRPFLEIDVEEDNKFIDGERVPVISAIEPLLQVARIHRKTTARKITAGPQWQPEEGPLADQARALLRVN